MYSHGRSVPLAKLSLAVSETRRCRKYSRLTRTQKRRSVRECRFASSKQYSRAPNRCCAVRAVRACKTAIVRRNAIGETYSTTYRRKRTSPIRTPGNIGGVFCTQALSALAKYHVSHGISIGMPDSDLQRNRQAFSALRTALQQLYTTTENTLTQHQSRPTLRLTLSQRHGDAVRNASSRCNY